MNIAFLRRAVLVNDTQRKITKSAKLLVKELQLFGIKNIHNMRNIFESVRCLNVWITFWLLVESEKGKLILHS
jgi:hypothetical protein